MLKRTLFFGGLTIMLVFNVVVRAQGRPDPESPRFKGLMALGHFLQSTGEDDLDAFIRDSVGADLRSRYEAAALRRLLAGLREEFRGIEARGGEPRGPFSAALSFEAPGKQGRSTVPFEVEPEKPHRFVSIDFGSNPGSSPPQLEFGIDQDMARWPQPKFEWV